MPVFPLVILLIAISFLLALQFWLYRRTRKINLWFSTKGKIVSSTIEREPNDRTPLWHTNVKYSYNVNGKPYRSTKIGIGNRFTDLPTAKKEFDQFPAGGEITVYYDPQNPENSVLVHDNRGFSLGLIIATLVLSLIFALLFFIKLLEIYSPKT